MIRVSRLNGKQFIVNCELIKFIEETPDTMITLVSGEKLMVKETPDEIVQSTMEYRQRIFREPPAREKKGD